MNIKYLLPVVAGLAMTACNSEDELLINSANELETSPITFTFTEDGPFSRAEVEAGQSVVQFREGDLTSLFNGITAWNVINNNAIYEAFAAESDNSGATLEFKTASMVNAGKAVMVYPADTTFAAITNEGIFLSVPQEQDANTKTKAPYITDVLNIAPYSGKDYEPEAGYGRQYPIAMKKVANTWRLDLNALNRNLVDNATVDGSKKVSPIVFQSAKIGSSTAIFNKNVKVVESANASLLATNNPNKGYEYVGKQTEYVDGTQVYSLTSTDFAKHTYNGNATESFTFTVLPNVTDVVAPAKTVIEIQTNYGKVEVWSAPYDKEDATTFPLVKYNQVFDDLLNYDLTTTIVGLLNGYKNQNTTADVSFSGQMRGGILPRVFTFDLKNLDMDELDIVDSEHLINVLSVYQALGLTSPIDLNLKTPNANNEFELTKAALDKLAEVNAAGNITLDDDQNANIITLTNGCVEEFNNAAVVVKGGEANVKLYGTLSLAQNTSTRKMESLEVAQGATLTLTPAVGTGVVAEWVPFAYNPAVGLLPVKSVPFTNNGTLKLDGKIYVGGLMSEGAVVIPQASSLYTSGLTTLQGTVENKGSLTSYNGNLTNLATIDNYGDITTLKANSATLVNGGIINMKNDDAILYMTKNVATVGGAYYIGQVNLKNRNDEVKVELDETSAPLGYAKGYIKYSLTAAEDVVFVSDGEDKFNFLVVNATTDLVKVDLEALSAGVTFLQITGMEANIIRKASNMVLRDLIIDSSMRWLSANATLTVKGNIYVGGIFKHAGNVAGTQAYSYTSGTWGVATDNTTYAKGEIKNTIG